jgi:hypothetical protein
MIKHVIVLVLAVFVGVGSGWGCLNCGKAPAPPTLGPLHSDWPLSGFISDAVKQHGNLSSMSVDPSGKLLWLLFETVSSSPFGSGTATLLSYNLPSSGSTGKREIPIDAEANAKATPPLGFSANTTIRVPIANYTYTLTGLTFNGASNFVLCGSRPDVDDFVVEDFLNSPAQGVIYTLNDQGQAIYGPARVAESPITADITGIAYDPDEDVYWVTDAAGSALYSTIITCCQEKRYLPSTAPQDRWQQQLALRRGVGLQYGLRGYSNIYSKRGFTKPPVILGNIAAPALGQPQDVTFDPETQHIWIVNNFPSTTVVELTADMQIVSHYNLEKATGGLVDAIAIAVTPEYLIVGFGTEQYVAVFDKPNASTGKDLVPARFRNEKETKHHLAELQLEQEEAEIKKKTQEVVKKEHALKGSKSHFQ